jgi:cytochrome d ubiquinol oxidase subunit II
MYGTLFDRPLAWIALLVALGGLVSVGLGLRGHRPLQAFLGSSAFLGGLLAATAALVFPVMLRATAGDALSLTAYNTAVPAANLWIALGWWLVAAPLVIVYFVVLFRVHRGKAIAPQHREGY